MGSWPNWNESTGKAARPSLSIGSGNSPAATARSASAVRLASTDRTAGSLPRARSSAWARLSVSATAPLTCMTRRAAKGLASLATTPRCILFMFCYSKTRAHPAAHPYRLMATTAAFRFGNAVTTGQEIGGLNRGNERLGRTGWPEPGFVCAGAMAMPAAVEYASARTPAVQVPQSMP